MAELQAPSACPTCGRRDPTTQEGKSRPFCSDRCKMVDLGKWLDGEYVLSRPVEADDLE